MRVFVLGGTRFMGAETARRLVAAGHDVAVMHRGSTPGDLPAAIEHITGDRAGLRDFRDTIAAWAPDVVLDMIAFTEADAQALVDAVAGIVARVVVASSQDVYRAFARVNRVEPGPPDTLPLTEDTGPLRDTRYPFRGSAPRARDDPERWRDDYDKILVEGVVMHASEPRGTILRLPAVYGPHDHQHRTWEVLQRMDAGRPAIVLGERFARWRWTHGYVENVADAIALAITDERAAGRVYNVGERDALTQQQWVQHIADAAGWQGEIITIRDDELPDALQSDIDASQDIIVDSTRIRDELGYQERIPRALAMARTVAWERAHPPADAETPAAVYHAEDAILERVRGD